MNTMTITKRFVLSLALAGAALLSPVGPLSSDARAQDIEVKGPLAGAPAVIGMRVYREMRFQIQVHGSLTLQDEFSRAVMVGGNLMFHPTDWLGIGLWGGFSVTQIDTALTDEVTTKGQTNDVNALSLPNADLFPEQIGNIVWVAAPQVHFIPLRGKLGIFEELFVDTDFYFHGGVAFVGLEERADVDLDTVRNCRMLGDTQGLVAQIQCLEPTVDAGDARASRTAIAPTFGVGLSLYLADFVAMTIEWRALPFAWNTSGTDESGDARGDFPDKIIDSNDHLTHFNHMMSLGFAFYLPAEPKLSYEELLDKTTNINYGGETTQRAMDPDPELQPQEPGAEDEGAGEADAEGEADIEADEGSVEGEAEGGVELGF